MPIVNIVCQGSPVVVWDWLLDFSIKLGVIWDGRQIACFYLEHDRLCYSGRSTNQMFTRQACGREPVPRIWVLLKAKGRGHLLIPQLTRALLDADDGVS